MIIYAENRVVAYPNFEDSLENPAHDWANRYIRFYSPMGFPEFFTEPLLRHEYVSGSIASPLEFMDMLYDLNSYCYSVQIKKYKQLTVTHSITDKGVRYVTASMMFSYFGIYQRTVHILVDNYGNIDLHTKGEKIVMSSWDMAQFEQHTRDIKEQYFQFFV